MRLWNRYLFRVLFNTFLFFLFCFFLIYVVVDLSVHGIRFISIGKATFPEIAIFYSRSFAMHLQYFLPITFLLAALKVLLDLNSHCELVALQMAGLSKKTLLRPFFSVAAILSLALYANSQWLAPDAQEAAKTFRGEHSSSKKKPKREHVYNLALGDDSELIYQSFNEKQSELFDVYWVKTVDDIWHMKYLKTDLDHPQGRYVDHLQRNAQGQFEKTESFPILSFPKLPWDSDATLERFVPFENRSISTLLSQASVLTADRQSIFTHLHYKIALPLLPFFIIIGISPVIMRFNRSRPTFLIVAISLCLCFGLMTILDGMLILGENQVIPSYLAIWSPMTLLFLATLRPFARL